MIHPLSTYKISARKYEKLTTWSIDSVKILQKYDKHLKNQQAVVTKTYINSVKIYKIYKMKIVKKYKIAKFAATGKFPTNSETVEMYLPS